MLVTIHGYETRRPRTSAVPAPMTKVSARRLATLAMRDVLSGAIVVVDVMRIVNQPTIHSANSRQPKPLSGCAGVHTVRRRTSTRRPRTPATRPRHEGSHDEHDSANENEIDAGDHVCLTHEKCKTDQEKDTPGHKAVTPPRLIVSHIGDATPIQWTPTR